MQRALRGRPVAVRLLACAVALVAPACGGSQPTAATHPPTTSLSTGAECSTFSGQHGVRCQSQFTVLTSSRGLTRASAAAATADSIVVRARGDLGGARPPGYWYGVACFGARISYVAIIEPATGRFLITPVKPGGRVPLTSTASDQAITAGRNTVEMTCRFAGGFLQLSMSVNGFQLFGTSEPVPDPHLDHAGVVLLTTQSTATARFDRIEIT